VTLELVGNGKFGPRGRQESHQKFHEMVGVAAKERDQDWIVTERPITASRLPVQGIWRGMKVAWARHLEWKNRKFASAGEAPPPPGA
jgi:hypothetical protein